MTKKEISLSLKEDHGIDLEVLEKEAQKAKTLSDEVKSLSEQKKELVSKIESIELAQKEKAVDLILSELMKEGKVTKFTADNVYKAHFLSIGAEKAAKIAKELPKVLKTEPIGVGNTGSVSEESSELTEDEKRDAMATKFMSQDSKLTYDQALRLVDDKMFGGKK